MKKISRIALLSVFTILCCCFTSCEKDNIEIELDDNVSNNISAPIYDKNLTTTDTDGFSIRLRFKNGGDERNNMSCKVHWKAYSKKPSSTPTEKELTKIEQMRIYDHTKTKTTFEKAHAGYNGGTYVYYYAECKNSKGSCKTKITYSIVKR